MVCPLAQTVPRVGRSPCAWGGSVTLTFAAGDSHQLQGAEVLPQDCESPPWHLVWGCRREGGSVGCSVTPGLGPQVQPCFNPANVLQIPALPLPSSLSFLVLVLGQEFGDAAASVPWERFDQGRGCWSSAVTEHLGPAHLSRGEGNIHLIIQLICCCDFPPGLGQTRVGP